MEMVMVVVVMEVRFLFIMSKYWYNYNEILLFQLYTIPKIAMSFPTETDANITIPLLL